MPNNTRRNTNRKREAELFQNVLGIASMSGYNNASRVGKHLSKRSAANNLTRMKRNKNAARIPNSIRRRLEDLYPIFTDLQREYDILQDQRFHIYDRYNNNERMPVRDQYRLRNLNMRIRPIEDRLSELNREMRRLRYVLNGNPENAPEAELPPNEFRARVNQLLRETRGEPEPEPAPEAAPRALTLANALRLFGPNA
jgi:hypothetical protein